MLQVKWNNIIFLVSCVIKQTTESVLKELIL